MGLDRRSNLAHALCSNLSRRLRGKFNRHPKVTLRIFGLIWPIEVLNGIRGIDFFVESVPLGDGLGTRPWR
jgi:hypothetical protein